MSEANQSECITVRIGHSLNEAEKNHVTSRRKSTLECLKKHGIQCSLEELPNIALLGSGGGERAMVGLLGSLLALSQDDLLDCFLYLAGISGSTWCMASLYKEPNWSNKLEAVKDDIVQKLVGRGVSLKEKIWTLEKYYREKDNFSLTDIWAVLFISRIVKEIDLNTFTSQHRSHHNEDPYPIYTVIDKHSKDDELEADTFVEITPHESGYSITGAFVESSSFGSQFGWGFKIKEQPEMDMLFLQGLCGSSLADREMILNELLYLIKHLIWPVSEVTGDHSSLEMKQTSAEHVDETGKLLLTLVELNLLVLREEDPSSHIKTLNDLLRGKLGKEKYEKLVTLETNDAIKNVKEYTIYICELHSDWDLTSNGIWSTIVNCVALVAHWIWGKTYNFLYNMTAEEVSSFILKEEKRQYVDAGIAINSPYLPVLREERHTDLIISLDFSEQDPFQTLTKTNDMCKKLHIEFPAIPDLSQEKADPKDFYVFEGQNAPTVIHIPLFNRQNCQDAVEKYRYKYRTVQGPYSSDVIDELLDKAVMNIKKNKERILDEIQKVIKQKTLIKTHG